MSKRGYSAAVVSALLAVAFAVPAAFAATPGAATPGAIAKDLADGRLDGKYTQKEMSAYLRSVSVQGYGRPATTVKNPTVKKQQRPAGGTLPFTGADLGLMGVGGGVLLALGVALRRFGRNRA